MTLEERIEAIAASLRDLVSRLTQRGFQFERPTEALRSPKPGAPAAIARIEREIGLLPAALKLFWLRVGSVDFCGADPDWRGCEYPDPLVVYPPSVAVEELDEFLADKEQRLRCDIPYL